MNILIAGASGFIGTELVNYLSKSHQITVLGRIQQKLQQSFGSDIRKLTWSNLFSHDAKDYDIIINLSGFNISARRWRESVKKEIIESRTLTNLQLIEWLTSYNAKPHFYCANAVGIYGAQATSSEAFDENAVLPSEAPHDFLQQTGLAWEQSLGTAVDQGIAVTTMRFGVVIKKDTGMLKKLQLPFSAGLGSTLGTGQQILSWVYYKDLIAAIDFLIKHPDITGPVNITAPYPVTQKEFAQTLASTMHRPLLMKTPAWLIRSVFGEMGDFLLLKGQKVIPKRLTESGFTFAYPDINSALTDAWYR